MSVIFSSPRFFRNMDRLDRHEKSVVADQSPPSHISPSQQSRFMLHSPNSAWHA
eukprot:CAMPEP_0113586058 /NCGR_PEP_ID=MMETSP0015_2-20120614/34081_1 /TAXON_ID=2838 /ORGANISM="Odontella" /LENGTH=53 /DNA_ID=CAMNT_0000491443 /DNA_START=560 /DNA_END=718 /DNA_ORIENTATION=- /assembly_acc=CAM_ASM_000160